MPGENTKSCKDSNRFIHLHGERGASLDARQSIHYSKEMPQGSPEISLEVKRANETSRLTKICSALMFGAPTVNLERFRNIYVDGLVRRITVGPFLSHLIAGWRDTMLLVSEF